MKDRERERLVDLQGVLLKLIETSNDSDEIEFLHELLEKINNKLQGDKK